MNTKEPNSSLSTGSPAPGDPSPAVLQKTSGGKKRALHSNWIHRLAIFILCLALAILLGGGLGYINGQAARQNWQQNTNTQALQEQYELGIQNLAEGQVEVARQRFEFILQQDPTYPHAAEQLAETMVILYATSAPTAVPATITPTPTPDPRPAEELLALTRQLLENKDWTAALETLMNLRKENNAFQTARVDGWMYLALRQRGVGKITLQSNLEGGLYDLALAERFGPLDAEAVSTRDLARLYLLGAAFWEAYPQKAVEYFSQVAAIAPGLKDASGWTASERLRLALIQYADQLAAQGEWCQAQQQYELALAQQENADLQATVSAAAEKCAPATPTPELTGTPTASPTLEEPAVTQTPAFTPTQMPTPMPAETQPPTLLPPTDTPPATPEPSATATPLPPPPAEPTATPLPSPMPESPTLPPVEIPPTPVPPGETPGASSALIPGDLSFLTTLFIRIVKDSLNGPCYGRS